MFSGIGGFDLALNRQGHQCVGYSEINEYSIQTYKKNFGNEVKNYGDATKINPEELADFDLLCGGFPCQTFSIAGKRRGFEDTRGTLFFDIARIIKTKRPSYILLENVKGLLSHNKGQTFSIIINTIQGLGYDVEWMVLNSKFFGVPQNRERVFIVGSIRGKSRPEILPISECIGETKELVYAQKSDREIARVYSPEGVAPTLHLKTGGWQEPKIITHSMFPRSSKTNKGGTGHLSKDDGTAYCLDSGNCQAIAIPVLTPDREKKRQNGRRFKENGEPSFTLTAQDKHGVSDGNLIRRLTPLECERLQGFPDGWTEGVSDTRRYNQCGNAVTVNVVEQIIQRMLNKEVKSGCDANDDGIPPNNKLLGILPTIL
jgi:DNA (cytosine-5)-methyltransferase 1